MPIVFDGDDLAAKIRTEILEKAEYMCHFEVTVKTIK